MVNHTGLGASQDLHRRVSGYYTSSQSSIPRPSLATASNYPCPTLRKQSDLQLIQCVQDNAKSRFSYFVKPPLSPFTLFFKSNDLEVEYRNSVYRTNENEIDFPPTLASAHFNTYLDVIVSAVIFFIVSISLFILYEPSGLWIGTFVTFSLFQLLAISLCFHKHWTLIRTFMLNMNNQRKFKSSSEKFLDHLSDWYPWHFFGGILLSLPIISVFVNFSCNASAFKTVSGDQSYYISLLCIGLIHFCNFTQINLWVKNSLVTLSAVFFICIAVLYCPKNSDFPNVAEQYKHAKETSIQHNLFQPIYSLNLHKITNSIDNSLKNLENTTFFDDLNSTGISNTSYVPSQYDSSKLSNLTNNILNQTILNPHNPKSFNGEFCIFTGELYLDIILFLILVWFLNREFEINYRMSFYGNIVANKDKVRVQNMRNQADWLLHNIIPRHVADQIKSTAKYSENHKDVGVIFASIVNFNELYDESYLGGKEYLRVLNELIGDFDELLEHPEFQAVDKIKTIGSTFMAASGLNPHIRRESCDPNAHLYCLMDFAIAMQKVVNEFNRDLLEFNLILRIGYNFGDVTAGVIGTTKLFYDIWGDAVNIASRMDSTGVNGRIQVGEACIPILGKKYEFEARGNVYVKGKDNMNVFLLLRKKPDDEDSL